nr:pitrilysin family protein [uncultured Mogibacterium sp.]
MLEVITLDSGVRLALNSMDSVRSVSIGIWCNNGSVNEKDEEQGISHFIEHMLFKGTKDRDHFQIVNEIDKLGGQMNAFTSKECTCFYVKCLDEHFRTTADVLSDMICNPTFPADELEKEKGVVIEEINMNADDPDDVAFDILEDNVYRGMGMSHPVLGTKETVSSFTHDKLNEYYFDHYTRDEIIVSVAGSFNKDEVIDYFKDKFYNLKVRRDIETDKNISELSDGGYIEVNKEIEQAHIAMGIRLFPASDSRRYPMMLLCNLLGGGMSSRLMQNVRVKKGLAYSVYSMTGFYSHTGLFVISAGVAKDKVDEALEAIKDELDRLKGDDISIEEFQSSKEQLKSSFIFGQESVQNLMIYNGRNLLTHGRCITPSEVLQLLDDISLDDINEVKKEICDYDRFNIINVTGNN